MKINNDYVMRRVGDNTILIPTRKAAYKNPNVIALNELGVFIMKQLSDAPDKDAVINAVLEEYDVGRDTAAADVSAFLADLRRAGVLLD